MDELRKHLDEIRADIKDINKAIASVDKTLVLQRANLDEHMRRSLANEKAVELLEQQVQPVREHVQMLNGGFKAIGVISLITGIALTLMKIFGITI